MPIYEMKCPKCEREYEFRLSISDYGRRLLECENCIVELTRHFKTAPNFTIPGHCTYDGITKVSSSHKDGVKKKEELAIPVQFENQDGSVTRIGKKSDIEND